MRVRAAGERRGATIARRGVRAEILALHRAIWRRNQAVIDASVIGYGKEFRRYERAYARGVGRYERAAGLAELDRELAWAEVIYVGDYHTLAQARRAFLRLVRRMPAGRPVTIALELVPARQQGDLEAYLAGALDDATLERRLGRAFADWTSYAEIFGLARQRGYGLIGIDRSPRGPAGTSLEGRDRFAARVIARARQRTGGAIMVLAGELHVAPPHLPARVASLAGTPLRQLVVYQNCEAIYAQLERAGREHEVELVRVREHEYALINTPPIVCQQSFLNWLEADDGVPELQAPEESFRRYVRVLAGFFELPLDGALDEVEVVSVADLRFLRSLRRRGEFSRAEMRAIVRQILASESYYIPRTNTVYLGKLAINHASEEATHFLRHVSAGSDEPRGLADAFYARCLTEALGFLGSKIINHKRKCAHEPELARLARSRAASESERRCARLALRHARMEGGHEVRSLAPLFEASPETIHVVTHLLGYRLGDKLYYGLLSGAVAKADVRALFFDGLDAEGAALSRYLSLVARTRDVVVPERL